MFILKLAGKILLLPVWLILFVIGLAVKMTVQTYAVVRGILGFIFTLLIIATAYCYHDWVQVVIDSFGAGEMPDAAQYGDEGTDTMGHISQNVDEFTIPNLQKLGIANLHPLKQVAAVERPMGYYTFLEEASTGKDTMTGHWEMMGLHITKPFKTFTETGFPKELIDELEKRTGHKVIGNKSSSGTEILDELAEEEIATGHMIVYTSADSVLQIC